MNAEKRKELYERHRSPYDRGSADSYYRRRYNPHYYDQLNNLITKDDMCQEALDAYFAGFYNNQERGDFKDYGDYEYDKDEDYY